MIKVDYIGIKDGREEVTIELSLETYVNKMKPFLRRHTIIESKTLQERIIECNSQTKKSN